MSSSLSKSLRLYSSLKIDEEAKVTEKQGIVSILGSDCERTKAASLRRTLSADMSSKKWLAQHGFSRMKKIASSQGLAVSIEDSSSSEGEEDYEEGKEVEGQGQLDIWSSIQEEKKEKELEKPAQFDIWSSIISQKAEPKSEQLPPPYIHPLVKSSASSLSEKSLEVCTESLGSETGSDGFSSYSPSETDDTEEDKEEVQEQEQQVLQTFDREEFRVVKYNYCVGRKSAPRSFPPPLPSLSHREGASLRMRSNRDNGRLVLEAVSVPSQNNFHAQRQDGRLVLTFVNSPSSDEPNNLEEEKNIMEEFEEEFENFEEYEEYEEEKEIENDDEEEDEEGDEEGVEKVEDKNGAKEMRIVMEQAPKLGSGLINVHRLALMMNKPMVIANRNPTWPNKFNEVVKFEEEEEDAVLEQITLAQSLPLRPRVARLIPTPPAAAAAATAAASFNAYEYCWRAKPMAPGKVLNTLNQQAPPPPFRNSSNKLIVSKNLKANEHQQGLFLRGNKEDSLVPLLRGCKEPRRSLLFWEPHCIATS